MIVNPCDVRLNQSQNTQNSNVGDSTLGSHLDQSRSDFFKFSESRTGSVSASIF